MSEPADKTAPETPPTDRLNFSLGTLMLLMTLASVCLGLIVFNPGLGVFACILLIPVLVRTAKVVRAREAAGGSVSPFEKVTLTTTSFGVATLIVILAWFAAVCCTCGTILTVISIANLPREHTEVWAVVLSASVLLFGIAAAFSLVKLLKWNHQRYERDIQPQSNEVSFRKEGESLENE